MARALKEMGSDQRPLVFTKCSIVWDGEKNVEHSLEGPSIRKEVEDSLRRLDVDVLDLCQIHRPSWPPDAPDPDLEEGWTALADLKVQGKIRYIGVSNFDVSQMERVHAISPITSLQPPYSMLMRQIEDEILPFCEKNSIGVLPYSTMQNGLLTGTWTKERVAAVAWVLHYPAVTGPIVGARSADQVDGFVGAMDFRLSEDEIAGIGEELPESVDLL